MRITSLSSALVLALGLGAAACGGGDDGYDTQRDAFEAIASAICSAGARCGELPEGTSESECRSMLVDFACADEDSDCDAAIPDDVTEEEIDACVDDLRDIACDAEDTPASCGEVPSPDTLRAALSKS
jgi:hypothetical protein